MNLLGKSFTCRITGTSIRAFHVLCAEKTRIRRRFSLVSSIHWLVLYHTIKTNKKRNISRHQMNKLCKIFTLKRKPYLIQQQKYTIRNGNNTTIFIKLIQIEYQFKRLIKIFYNKISYVLVEIRRRKKDPN